MSAIGFISEISTASLFYICRLSCANTCGL
jgi:hypothetical protein